MADVLASERPKSPSSRRDARGFGYCTVTFQLLQLQIARGMKLEVYASLTVVEELRAGHDSMAYGLSWAAPFACSAQAHQEQASTPGLTATALASASFYDCSLNVATARKGKRSALVLNC